MFSWAKQGGKTNAECSPKPTEIIHFPVSPVTPSENRREAESLFSSVENFCFPLSIKFFSSLGILKLKTNTIWITEKPCFLLKRLFISKMPEWDIICLICSCFQISFLRESKQICKNLPAPWNYFYSKQKNWPRTLYPAIVTKICFRLFLSMFPSSAFISKDRKAQFPNDVDFQATHGLQCGRAAGILVISHIQAENAPIPHQDPIFKALNHGPLALQMWCRSSGLI